ncbi:class I SAM-dependent methyltransferase [Candidatus Nitrotoga sp. M5]|uniref:class I SAM-dependent methyltransferase n=1 Tax=Candidatus Nitrotoga sp. M5 TaxID=2890409 RepID=UPI001EF24904|nr:SAM-dependent methyltransferase [Candidatus Nitrotoga sp. M5]CAH1386117.1 SAM-dependent methyltransferase, MidA family [Candidatus Nitrotoga sp. M5]
MLSLPLPSPEAQAHSDQVRDLIHYDILRQGGWIPFSRFMELALYAPGMGYYSAGARKFGAAGDFVTAPEISTLFGRTLARQLVEIMAQSTPHIIELGAGSGKLAVDILSELEKQNSLPERYDILEVSADLRERQQALLQARLPHLINRVHWLDALPDSISGVLVANEVLDALPVHLVRWTDANIVERGVASEGDKFVWQERLPENSMLREIAQQIKVPEDTLSDVSLAARGLVKSLSERLQQGALLFIDYGFGAREFYHPQRTKGTLMCHYRHHAHDDPFFMPGLQDITAHVDFTAVAEAAIDAGLHLYGYTTQAYFLINSGITGLLAETDSENVLEYLPLSAELQKLTSPAEMGELFKIIALGNGVDLPLSGFVSGDKSRLL